MCLICIDFQKERMTIKDAKRAYREMVVDMGPEHAKEVRTMIEEAERKQREACQAQHTLNCLQKVSQRIRRSTPCRTYDPRLVLRANID